MSPDTQILTLGQDKGGGGGGGGGIVRIPQSSQGNNN